MHIVMLKAKMHMKVWQDPSGVVSAGLIKLNGLASAASILRRGGASTEKDKGSKIINCRFRFRAFFKSYLCLWKPVISCMLNSITTGSRGQYCLGCHRPQHDQLLPVEEAMASGVAIRDKVGNPATKVWVSLLRSKQSSNTPPLNCGPN